MKKLALTMFVALFMLAVLLLPVFVEMVSAQDDFGADLYDCDRLELFTLYVGPEGEEVRTLSIRLTPYVAGENGAQVSAFERVEFDVSGVGQFSLFESTTMAPGRYLWAENVQSVEGTVATFDSVKGEPVLTLEWPRTQSAYRTIEMYVVLTNETGARLSVQQEGSMFYLSGRHTSVFGGSTENPNFVAPLAGGSWQFYVCT